MKNYFRFALPIILFQFFLIQNNFSQDENVEIYKDYNANFELYSNYYFSPADSISIRVHSNLIERNPLFNFEIYKIKDVIQFLLEQKNKYGWDVVTTDSINLSDLCERIGSFDKLLFDESPPKKNPNDRSFFSNIKLPPLNKGAYIIRVNYKKKISYMGFFVTNLGLVTKQANNMFLCYSVNRYNGEPVSGLQIKYTFDTIIIGEGFTNEEGISVLSLTDSNRAFIKRHQNTSPLMIGSNDSETVVSDPYAYFNFIISKYNAYIYTNQPVYKPPAIVEFKGTIRKYTDKTIENVPEQEIIVTVNDSKNSTIYRKVLKSNSNGTFSGEIQLDEEAQLGNYTIKASINENITFSSDFLVEEYKKPEYFVELNVDKPQYSNGDVVTGTIRADYYFGNPVQEAEVHYRIFKKPYYKPWWYFSEYRWWYEENYLSEEDRYRYSSNTFIYEGSGRLDKNGKLEILYNIEETFKEKYPYKKDEYYETDYMYIIEASVTDKSRRKISNVKSFYVTRAAFNLTVNTDKYFYKPGEKMGIAVHASDFSDAPVSSQFNVTVTRINYGKAPKHKKKITYVTNLSGFTNKDGFGMVYFDAADEGYYNFEVSSFDDKKSKVEAAANCFLTSGNMDWWFYQKSNTIQIIPDKFSYLPGDTCKALIITPIPDVTVLMTINSDNIFSYRTEKIEGDSKFIKIPILENYAPNYFIDISFIYKSQLYNSRKPVLVIPASKFLYVQLNSDKQSYKPGEEGHISALVKDNTGAPVKDAEICIGIVDESVYAIQNDATKDIRNFFYGVNNSSAQTNFGYNNSVAGHSRYLNILDKFQYKSISEFDFGYVLGVLKDQDDDPVNNAKIIINNEYVVASTNLDGEFKFKISKGIYHISIVVNDFDYSGEVEFKIEKGKSLFLDLRTDGESLREARLIGDENGVDLKIKKLGSEKNGGIGGTITDWKDKTPISGAGIKIIGTDFSTESDFKGMFNFPNVPVGIYSVICTCRGYKPLKVSDVEVYVDKKTYIYFDMRGSSGIFADTIVITAQRKGIDVEMSGREITTDQMELIQHEGMRGIMNIGSTLNLRNAACFVEGQFIEPELRKNFLDAIYWTPSIFTDENGEAKIDFKFPDNLTTWRITARIITSDTKVGQFINTVVSRKDLIVRMETPRFFQDKDQVTISTIIHNYLNEDKQTKVSLNVDNLVLANAGDNNKLITMKKNEERRIDWKVKVNQPADVATLTAKALTNEESDAVQYKVPLQPLGLPIIQSMTFDFSNMNKTVLKTVEIPEDINLKSAKMKIGISPSISSMLLSSLDDLIGYPYGCIEQTMSRFLPTVIVANIFKNMNAPMDEYLSNQIPKMVSKSLGKIYSMQNSDGGWGWWGNAKSEQYMSSYVIYGLSLAKSVGFEIKKQPFQKGTNFLLKSLDDQTKEPTSIAFTLYALSFVDSVDRNIFYTTFDSLSWKKLNDFGNALLSLTASNIGDKETQRKYNEILLKNFEREGEDQVYWGGKIFRYKWQEDNILTTSMVIKAILDDPVLYVENKQLIEKAINWLMAQKKGNGWGNTMQNAFIIYALADYVNTDNELNPDYKVNVYVNNEQVIEKQITKDDIFKKEFLVEVPGNKLKSGENEIKIEKSGEGKLYFTDKTTYYSNEQEMFSMNKGFDITKEYYLLELHHDYENNKITYVKTPFNKKVKSGDEILVKIKVKAKDDNSQYFMLEDPIPAGCEVIKDDWGYTIEEEKDYAGWNQYWWRWWYSDKEIHDNRVSFFATYLWGDTYEFSYILRAQIPGVYNVIPATGSLMYYPEVRGSSEELKLEIEE